jgi:hypothetical protein
LRKRFAFVAGNDGVTLAVIAPQRARECAPTGSVKQSVPLRHCERSEAIHLAARKERMDCFVASLLAMTV